MYGLRCLCSPLCTRAVWGVSLGEGCSCDELPYITSFLKPQLSRIAHAAAYSAPAAPRAPALSNRDACAPPFRRRAPANGASNGCAPTPSPYPSRLPPSRPAHVPPTEHATWTPPLETGSEPPARPQLARAVCRSVDEAVARGGPQARGIALGPSEARLRGVQHDIRAARE